MGDDELPEDYEAPSAMSEPKSKRVRREPGEPASGEGADEASYAVRSAEGLVLRWPRLAALRAVTLKGWIEETGGEDEFPTPLATQALEALRAACAHEGDEANSPLTVLQLDETAELLHAAHYLEATGVFEAAARHLCGTLLAGKSVDQLRSALGVANDLSADEQAAAQLEPFFTLPEGLGTELSSAPPAMRRSLSTSVCNEDVVVSALQAADTTLLCRLKAVSRAWRERARDQMCVRLSCRGAGQRAPTSLEEIDELDVELLSAAGRAHELVAAVLQLPSLARLRGWGFVVDVQAVRQVDLSHVKEEDDEEEDDEEEDGDEEDDKEPGRTVSTALRACTQGEGEPPLELLLAAVVCAASGEVLHVPVQQLRESDLVELNLSGRNIGVCGGRLLGLLLPVCTLVRLE